MHPASLVAFILAGVVSVSNAEAQYHYPSPFFRSYPAAPAPAPSRIPDGRFFFGSLTTVTFTVSTSTTTVTATTTTTCTTSTAALSPCTAGRRRRALLADEHGSTAEERPKGLLYDEENQPAREESAEKENNVDIEPVRASRQLQAAIPYGIQPTFGAFYAPEAGYEQQAPIGRFFLALGTATVTSTVTSTATSALTATCSSTTSYKTCSA